MAQVKVHNTGIGFANRVPERLAGARSGEVFQKRAGRTVPVAQYEMQPGKGRRQGRALVLYG